MQALANDGAVIPVLTGLIASEEAAVRREAALAIASLTLVYQGRIAAADAATVAALAGPLRADEDADVRAACAAGRPPRAAELPTEAQMATLTRRERRELCRRLSALVRRARGAVDLGGCRCQWHRRSDRRRGASRRRACWEWSLQA